MTLALPALYPIVNLAGSNEEARLRAKDLATTLAAAGATLLQIRAKELATGPFVDLASWLVERLTALDCRLIVNDRTDIALAAAAAGVHLGGDDMPVATARRILGPGALIGFSTHDDREVRSICGSETARCLDYLAFGPVFESPTKAGVRQARGVDGLAAACASASLPVVAIGGVTLVRAPSLWAAGAASAAAISELESSDDPATLPSAWELSRKS
ncbi:MAG: thiamine phosphate synthase [Candidatus Binatia bacterium]